MSDEEETFCIYCQKEYASEGRLRRHVLTKHEDTYKASAFIRSSTQQHTRRTRMSTDNEWEDVNAPRGSYIGWGEVGQRVTGYVISYGDNDGTDQNGNVCPQVVLELTEDATSFRKNGTEKETIAKGEFATITCAQASLKKTIKAAALETGNLLRIIFDDTQKVDKGIAKLFKVQVNRSARPSVSSSDLV